MFNSNWVTASKKPWYSQDSKAFLSRTRPKIDFFSSQPILLRSRSPSQRLHLCFTRLVINPNAIKPYVRWHKGNKPCGYWRICIIGPWQTARVSLQVFHNNFQENHQNEEWYTLQTLQITKTRRYMNTTDYWLAKKISGSSGIRTRDLLLTRQAL